MENYGQATRNVLRRAAANPNYGQYKAPNTAFGALKTTFEMNEAKRAAAAKAPVKKWATVQTRKNRKANRKTRKNRKANRKSRKAGRR